MTAARRFVVVAVVGAALASGCTPPSVPGMALVPSSGASSGPGALLVAFPKSACTGAASAVFLDDKGGFVGAVAPGTATYLAFPEEATRLFVVSSQDVSAAKGMWFRRRVVKRPPERVEIGLIVEVARRDAKSCDRDAPPVPTEVSYEDATRASKELQWLDVRPAEGVRWVDDHRARVTELLAPAPPAPAPPAP